MAKSKKEEIIDAFIDDFLPVLQKHGFVIIVPEGTVDDDDMIGINIDFESLEATTVNNRLKNS